MFSPYFNLLENPFAETPDVRFFYASRTHLLAIERIVSAVDMGKSLILVTGEVGYGKTLLCRVLMRLFAEKQTQTAMILQPIFQDIDLISQIASEFGLPPAQASQPRSMKEEIDRLNQYFIANAKRGQRSVILIDEAHKLSFEALEALRLFTNIETESKKIVQVILLAQPEIQRKLEVHHMRQFQQRVSTHITLQAYTTEETSKYLAHRLEVAGGENFVRFDERAVGFIHAKSQGVPRLINFFAELAVLTAKSQEQRLIDKTLVRQAFEEKNQNTLKGTLRRLFDLSQW